MYRIKNSDWYIDKSYVIKTSKILRTQCDVDPKGLVDTVEGLIKNTIWCPLECNVKALKRVLFGQVLSDGHVTFSFRSKVMVLTSKNDGGDIELIFNHRGDLDDMHGSFDLKLIKKFLLRHFSIALVKWGDNICLVVKNVSYTILLMPCTK